MKIQEISEARQQILPLFKAADYIKTNCQPWLQAVGLSQFAYRGLQTTGDAPVRLVTVRHNRIPVLTNRDIHSLYNHIIDLAGGVANRSNSAFVSGNQTMASTYGNVFAIFPVGEFHYTASPIFRDWTITLNRREMVLHMLKRDSESDLGKAAIAYMRRHRNDEFDHLSDQDVLAQLTDNDFLSAAYAWDASLSTFVRPKSFDPERIKQVVHADVSHENLKKHLDIGHEIMIKCEKYVAVSTAWLREVLDEIHSTT